MRLAALTLIGAAIALLAAAPAPQAEPLPLPLPERAPQALPPDAATLKGVVKVKGIVPKRTKLRTEADPKCAAQHKDGLWSEEVVATPAGQLQWAFVYAKKGHEEKKFEIPKKPVEMTQKACRFEPHVFGIMAGQQLMIRNGDELMHIIHVTPRNNKEFGFSQATMGESRPKVFDKAEFPIRVFCDVHPWMQAWAIVLDHPLHDATDQLGRYEIKGIPPGKYAFEVWHEYYKSVEQEIELKPKETKTVNFELSEKK
jgi:hypothetical protein